VDSTLLTNDKRITAEVAAVFAYLENAATLRAVTAPRFKHLLVSPFNSRRQFMAMFQKEKEKGKDGYVLIKLNHLTDPKIIKKLYDLADAGVQMDFIVRTTYAMKPHKNIRAISILDRYLEHQRVYIFGKGKERRIYLGSADLMERNLDWRVEVAFPILDEGIKELIHDLMQLQIADTAKARILDETQSNPYVGTTRDGCRTQWTTRAYFEAQLESSGNGAATE
jgi:polyphosphate kinase